jgi:anti-sigma B factor antagonist
VIIEVHFNQDVPIVSLSGKFLAGGDGPFLRQKVKDLIDAGTTKLIIDFARVPYIDSTGLGFLAGTREAAQVAGVRIVLASLNQHVRRILDHAQLTSFFLIAEDESGAVAKLNEPPAPDQDSKPSSPKEPKGKRRPGTTPEA